MFEVFSSKESKNHFGQSIESTYDLIYKKTRDIHDKVDRVYYTNVDPLEFEQDPHIGAVKAVINHLRLFGCNFEDRGCKLIESYLNIKKLEDEFAQSFSTWLAKDIIAAYQYLSRIRPFIAAEPFLKETHDNLRKFIEDNIDSLVKDILPEFEDFNTEDFEAEGWRDDLIHSTRKIKSLRGIFTRQSYSSDPKIKQCSPKFDKLEEAKEDLKLLFSQLEKADLIEQFLYEYGYEQQSKTFGKAWSKMKQLFVSNAPYFLYADKQYLIYYINIALEKFNSEPIRISEEFTCIVGNALFIGVFFGLIIELQKNPQWNELLTADTLELQKKYMSTGTES